MKKFGSNAFKKAGGGLAGMVVVLAILIAANIIIGNLRLRADLTEEKLYTLSKGSREVLKKLDNDVVLKLFSNCNSPETPVFLKNFSRQVEDLLKEYQLASGGRVTLEIQDPKPDSDAEEWAQRYGITGQPMDMFGSALYFGLVAISGSAEAAIPALDPRTESLLEYNITRLIYRVGHPKKPVVAMLGGLPVMGVQAPPYAMPGQPRPEPKPAWIAFRDLGEDYDVRNLSDPVETIDPDVDALILVHPKNLSDKAQYAVDQFVLRGGRLLLFVDPFCIADMETGGAAPSPYGGPNASSDLPRLLSAWGVGYDAGQMLADLGAASRVRGANNRIEESPVWLSMDSRHVNKNDVLTSQLESLMVPMAGAFTDNTSSDVVFTPLISSTTSAGLVPAMTAQFGGSALRNAFKDGGVSLPLAVRISGEFKTAFPGGAPKDESENPEAKTDETAAEPAPGLQSGKSTIVLVADVDLLYDRFCGEELNFFGSKAYRPLNDNLNFFANAVEQLAGSADLIGIRSRGKFNRPFDRVIELQKEAVAAWQTQEKALEQSLRDTQTQLRELQAGKEQNQQFILSHQQREAVENFRKKEFQIKQQLKDVRKNLRSRIENLGVAVKVINIAMIPLLVAMAGLGYGLYRRTKR